MISDEVWELFEKECGKDCAASFQLFFRCMVNRMIVGAEKYGATPNLSTQIRDLWETILVRIETGETTKNTDLLVDVANFCAMAYHPPAGVVFSDAELIRWAQHRPHDEIAWVDEIT